MKIQIPIFPNPHSRIRCQGWHNGNACSMMSWHLNISGTSKEKVSIRTEEGRMEAMNHLVNWGNKNRTFVRAQTMKVGARHAGISHCPRLFFVAFNGCSHSPWSSQTERGVSFKSWEGTTRRNFTVLNMLPLYLHLKERSVLFQT